MPRRHVLLILAASFVISGCIFVYVMRSQPPHGMDAPRAIDLETQLRDTAWIQVDAQGGTIEEELDFQTTQDNDPEHAHFDYREFLHQRPGEAGYWKTEGNTLTLVSTRSDTSVAYTDVTVAGGILTVTDALNDVTWRFKKVLSSGGSSTRLPARLQTEGPAAS